MVVFHCLFNPIQMCTIGNKVRIANSEEENYIKTFGKGELCVFLKTDKFFILQLYLLLFYLY